VAEGLDRLVRPTVLLHGRPRSAFHLCGVVGLVAALATCTAVLAARGVALWALPLLGATGVATFLGLALAVKVVSGRESLIYYHHEVAILLTCGAAAAAAGLPVLASLDAAVLGIGAFLACGRVGCLLVGCCHGLPARRGVRYGDAHAAAGFPAELVGVRLLPVQGIEAIAAAAITAAGLLAVAAGARPGVPLLLYVSAYGLARFALEEWRGDPGRRRLGGLSEAQWTSLALTAVAAATAPAHRWAAACAAGAIAAAMLVLAWRRRRSPLPAKRDAARVTEVARALRRLDETAGGPVAVPAGRGVRLSGGTIDGEGCRHYTLSGAPTATLRDVAVLVLALRHPGVSAQEARLIEGRGGVLHVLVPDAAPATARAAPGRRGRAPLGEGAARAER
jgi:prolipoprotein diacylglyceryltransferase